MLHQRLSVSVLLMVILIAATIPAIAQDPQHFEFVRTDVNMSIIVNSATLEGDDLVPLDEIGVFTPGGLCAGASVVPDEGFPVGVAAWQREQGQNNGFAPGDDIAFRVWDHEVDEEWEAEITEVIAGEPVFEGNGFLVVNLEAFRGPDRPAIVVSENEHDFGVLRVGQQAEWSFVVSNRGRQNLVIQNMEIDGEGYAVDFDGEVTLGFQESREYTVTFAPQDEGELPATLMITSNDEEAGPVRINLMGVGEPALPPNVVLSAVLHNFGRVFIGNSRNWVMRLGNDGDETLTVTAISSELDVFTTDFEGEVDLASGESIDVTVTFTPEEAAAYAGDLTIASNDPDGDATVRLLGEGVEAGEPPIFALEQDEHFFGNVVAGASSVWRMVILNGGGSNLIVYSVESDNDAFTTSFGVDSVYVRPGDRWYVWVTFTPPRVAFFDGGLTITTNDPENGEVVVPVSGVGGAADARHFRYQNTADNHTLLINEVILDGEALGAGSEVGVFAGGGYCAGGGTIGNDGRVGLAAWGDDEGTDIVDGFQAEESFTFRVWDRDAGAEGTAEAEFEEGPEVYTTNGFSVLTLNAATIPPQPFIAVSDNFHLFGQVRIDDSEDWVMVVSNRGQGPLHIESVGSDEDAYTTDFDQPVDLAAGESIEIIVTFSPTAERRYIGRLTITSDDPQRDVHYIDLMGDGVQEVREPVIDLAAENHFFGVRHLNDQRDFVLTINNAGGADLEIRDIARQGDQAFTSNWPGQRRIVPVGQSYDLTITFTPGEARQYDGTFVITSNDPENGEIVFAVRGYGSASQDHFLHLETPAVHRILVSEAVITLLNGEDSPLVRGDEVAVFTPAGLCAGHIVVADGEINFLAFADDANTPFRDGFIANQPFTFMFYDRSTRDELECETEFINGPQSFTVGGQTEVHLRADAIHAEAQIAADPTIIHYGVVRVNQQRANTFRIFNAGGQNLTITDVQPIQNVFTTDWEGGEVVLEPDEGFDLTVTFRPVAPLAYEGTVIIINDDPDEGEQRFEIHPVGIGSNFQGHFLHIRTDVNHSILIQEIDLGGVGPAFGDEVGVFTEDGLCAGATIITNPEEAVGVAAWGDDADTRILVDGFTAGEAIAIRYWDASQREEYEPEIEIAQGALEWAPNGFTIISLLSVEGVFSIRPVAPIEVNEDEEVNFELTLVNAEGEFEFEWLNPDEYENIRDGDIDFDFADNEANFRWRTTFDDAGEYALRFAAFNEENRDEITVRITVLNVNRAPVVVEDVRQQVFGDNDEFHIPEDLQQLRAVVDCDELFADPDGNRLIFSFATDNNLIEWQLPNNTNILSVRPRVQNFSGRVDARLRAIENLNLQNGRQVREVHLELSLDEPGGRSLRRTDGDNPDVPDRDLQVDYNFTIVVDGVNDAPVIIEPANADVYNHPAVNEDEEIVINFRATDVDNQGDELRWDISDRGNLPDGFEFTDNQDGTARFNWDTGFDHAGNFNFTARVQDAADAADQIRVNLTVRNVNRDPQLAQAIPDQNVNEDVGLVAIGDLRDFFTDPDGDNLAFSVRGNPPAQLQIRIDNNTRVLSFNPVADYNLPDGVDVTVRATDPSGRFIEDIFNIVVNPLNDPPGAFNLLTPQNNFEIPYQDSLGAVGFSWQAAQQNQWEVDAVGYVLAMRMEAGEDTVFFGPIDSLNMRLTIQEIVDSLMFTREESRWILWTVLAVDDSAATPSANGPFRFSIPALGVADNLSVIPGEYYVAPIYPNPFNASTTLRFGLPIAGQVEISVWDMHGRMVGRIASQRFEAGRYEMAWDGGGLTSGIYLIRFQSGTWSAMQKAILIR